MLTTNGTCETCAGRVTNADGKTYSLAELTAIHDDTCPGRYRRTTK